MKKNIHKVLSIMCGVTVLSGMLSMNSASAANGKKPRPKSQQIVPMIVKKRSNPNRRSSPPGQNVAMPARPAANFAAEPASRSETRATAKPASKPSTRSEEKIVREKLAKLGSEVAAIATKRLSAESATRPETNSAAESTTRLEANSATEPAAKPVSKPSTISEEKIVREKLAKLGSEVAAIATKRAPINPEELEASQRREYLENSLSNIMAECSSVGVSDADIKDPSGNIVIEKFVAFYVSKLNVAYRNHFGRDLLQDFSTSKAIVEYMSEKNKMNNERCRFLEFIANYLQTKSSEGIYIEELSSLALATHCIAQILDTKVLNSKDVDFMCSLVVNINPEIASPINKQNLHILKIMMYN